MSKTVIIELTLPRKNIEAALKLMSKPVGRYKFFKYGSIFWKKLFPPSIDITRERVNLAIELGEMLNNAKVKASEEDWANFVGNEKKQGAIGFPYVTALLVMSVASMEFFSKSRDAEWLATLVQKEGLDVTFKNHDRMFNNSKILKRQHKEIQAKRDPVEETPEFKAVIKAVRKQANTELRGHPRRGGLGYCHVEWDAIQRILRDEHGIRWRTPPQMNIGVMYD